MSRVAIEESLSNVKEVLEEHGHQVMILDGENMSSCDCCVISGQDQNMMGIQDMVANIPIVNADGLTPEEVLQAIEKRNY